MSRLFRIISIIMIAAGFVYLVLYTRMQGQTALGALERPSYYAAQSYTLLFLAGIAVLAFSLIGSFFSWFKALDKKEEVLPNAGYASPDNIDNWLRGTTADKTGTVSSAGAASAAGTPAGGTPQTTVLPAGNTGAAGETPQTTVLSAGNTGAAERSQQTEVLSAGADPKAENTAETVQR